MKRVLLLTQPSVTTYPEIANNLSLLWNRKDLLLEEISEFVSGKIKQFHQTWRGKIKRGFSRPLCLTLWTHRVTDFYCCHWLAPLFVIADIPRAVKPVSYTHLFVTVLSERHFLYLEFSPLMRRAGFINITSVHIPISSMPLKDVLQRYARYRAV